MKRWFILLSLLVLAGLFTAVATAQQGVSDDEVNAVAKKLYCPVCENTPLDVCPTQACKDWRELIRQQLSQGWTEQQVLEYFAATYGPQVLAQPPITGFFVLVWILPILALTGGGIFLWRLVRRWQNSPRPVVEEVEIEKTSSAVGIHPEILARIEHELETRF